MYVYTFGSRIYVDTFLIGPFVPSTYKHWKRVQSLLESEFASRSITEYYAIVDNEDKYRWCKFLGFESNYELIGDKIEVMVKTIGN